MKVNPFDKIVFNYIDSQDFSIIKKNEIYFVKHKKDRYAKIKYDIEYQWCFIDKKFNDEVSSFFSLPEFDSEITIGKWVEKRLNMCVVRTIINSPHYYTEFIIPN